MVLVSLQGQVSVLLTDEANQSFSVPPALSVQAECNPSSGETQQTGQCGKAGGGDGVHDGDGSILGDVESSEEASDVLVGGLPRQPPGSDHRAVAHLLHLTAATNVHKSAR